MKDDEKAKYEHATMDLAMTRENETSTCTFNR
jgi:hypothetical protein